MGQEKREARVYTIRNVDALALTQVRIMKQELKITELKRAELRALHRRAVRACEGDVSAADAISDVDAVHKKLAENEALYARRIEACAKAIRDAEETLARIENPGMRLFVTLLYERGETHKYVMAKLGLSRRSFEKLRKTVEDAPDMASVVWADKWVLDASSLALREKS